MKIVTFVSGDDFSLVRAMTADEFAESPEIIDAADEYVWQDQPTKEVAIARHDEAFVAWRKDIDANNPVKETY